MKIRKIWKYGVGRWLAVVLGFSLIFGMIGVPTDSYGEETRHGEENGYAIESGNEEIGSQVTRQLAELNRKLYAQSAVLMDADTGRILYGKEADIIRPMASTTKIMTCILALENGNLDDVVTVSSYAASQPKVHLGAPAGRKFYLRDLLYSLMLESHNDTAVMIAEHIGGSVEEFARMMNQKARDLGCENTCFITPNGLDATATAEDGTVLTHSTTAADLAGIMSYCVWKSPKREQFLEITQTQNYYFSDTEGKGSYSCVNHNALLNMIDGAVSGKTGFTSGAGYSYVAAVEDEERHFTLALLGCGWPPHKTYKWSDARALINYGKENYRWTEVYQELALNPVPVPGGIGETGSLDETPYVELTMGDDSEISLKVLVRADEQVEIQSFLPEQMTPPVQSGSVVGRVDYLLDDSIIRSFPVYAKNGVEDVTLSWCIKKMIKEFLFWKK